MIRPYDARDFEAIRKLHAKSGLPAACLPDARNPNFIVSLVSAKGKDIMQAGFVKLTGEAFVLVDHETGTPQERWADTSELIAHGLASAAAYGIDDISAWLPPELEKSFGPRLESLGWIKSPWRSYSALLR